MTKKTASKPKKTKTTTASATTSKKTTTKTVVTQKVSTVNALSLLSWNKWVAFLYLIQAIALVVAAKTYSLPVTMTYLTKDTFASPSHEDIFAPAVRHLFDLNILYALAGVLLLAALLHVLYATVYRKRYEKELEAGVNRMRWAGYSIITSSVTVIIALVVGLRDLTVLVPLVSLILIAHLAGLAVEVYSQRKNRRRLAYVIAGAADAMPWVVISGSLITATVLSTSELPLHVYGVVIAAVVSLLLFAVAFTKRFRNRGKWQEYMYAERAYSMVLFILLTLVTWIMFAGVLQP